MTVRLARDYPERSTAMLRGFGGPLDRSAIAGVAACVVAAVVVSIAARSIVRVDLAPIVGAIAGAVVGLAVARLAIPAGLVRAYETFSWMGRAEVDRFEARTGGKVPLRRPDQERWLVEHPPAPAYQLSRIEVLAFLGRLDEARNELRDVVATDGPVAFERASLVQYVDWLSDGEARLETLRASLAELHLDGQIRREAEVMIAVADARERFMHGDHDWWRPLEDVRPSLGSAASRVVWRDRWRQLAVLFLVIGFVAGAPTFLLFEIR